MLKNDSVQESRDQRGDFAVGKSDDGDVSRGGVDESESFTFASEGLALPLEIHHVAGPRGSHRLGSEKSMSFVSPCFVQLANRTIV
jgi:hypothetical protein